MFFFEVVELLRRTVWAMFRIEWEVIVKVHRAAAYDLLPLTSTNSLALEEGGEEEE